MEKIQAAIAKARASRAADTRQAAAPAKTSTPAARPVPITPAAPARTPWDALAPFTPDPRLMERHHVVSLAGGRAAAGFDMMRTKLVQQMRANGWRRVAITSAAGSSGKSTVTLNLGLSLARLPEITTLVAEVDFRRPSLGRLLGLREKHAFASVLAGEAAFADHAVRYGDNLAIATNHAPIRNPAELLAGSTVAPALKAIEDAHAPDIVLFDMPPLLVSDDAMAFIGHVDCALLVAAAGDTTVAEVDRCERELAEQTNVLGIVLNKCRDAGPDYGYDYYG